MKEDRAIKKLTRVSLAVLHRLELGAELKPGDDREWERLNAAGFVVTDGLTERGRVALAVAKLLGAVDG